MLTDKYAPESERIEKQDKKIISDDAFAICEFLEKLIHQMRRYKNGG